MSEHAGDVVPPRVSVDRAAGFIVAVLLRLGVEEVADLPRRVAGAAAVHFEDERQKARPGRRGYCSVHDMHRPTCRVLAPGITVEQLVATNYVDSRQGNQVPQTEVLSVC